MRSWQIRGQPRASAFRHLLLLGCLLGGSALLRGEFRPLVLPVSGVPPEAIWLGPPSQSPDDGAWVAQTKDGILRQRGGEWSILPHPGGEILTAAVPHPLGVAAYTRGSFWLHASDRWTRLPIEDESYWLVRAGSDVFFHATHAVYRLDHTGALSTVLRFTKPKTTTVIRVFNGHVVIPSPATGEMFEWDGRGFISRPLPDDLREALGGKLTAYVRDCDYDSYYFSGREIAPQKFFAPDARPPVAGLRHNWPAIKRQILARPGARVGSLFWFQTPEGIAAWSGIDGQLRWRIESAVFGGKITSLNASKDGLVVAGEKGLFIVLDPECVTTSLLPQPPIVDVNVMGGIVRVITAGGSFRLDGTPLLGETDVSGLSHAADGSVITVVGNRLHWRGRELAIPADAEGSYLAELNPELLVLMRRAGTFLIDARGEISPLKLPGPSTALATTKRSAGALVSTAEGFVRLDMHGREVARFGSGACTLVEMGDQHHCADANGRIFDEDGRLLMLVPFTRSIYGCELDGRTFLLGRLADGNHSLIELDLAHGRWTALDVPLPQAPNAVAVENGFVHVVGSSDIHRLAKIPVAPTPQVVAASLDDGFHPLHARPLGVDEKSAWLRLPAARIKPWVSAQHTYQIDDSPARPVPASSLIPLQVHYGTTEVRLTVQHLGRSASRTLQIERTRPWWLSWPGGTFYVAVLLGVMAGGVRWRTRQLRHRSEELERIVTERTEQLRQANAVKAEFIDSMNHEIRNPINGIVGLSEMLRERTTDPRQHVLLEALESCTLQLRATLDDVLDFSAIERGKMTLAAEDFDLRSLVRAACQAHSTAEFAVTHSDPTADPCWCHGDAGKIRLILGNYLSNAAKYGVPPQATVTWHVQPGTDGQPGLHLEVTSPGPSLGAEEQAKLFHAFVRGSRAQETKTRGMGLGLVMCRRYAEAMGGSTGVASSPGRNTFWLQIPVQLATAPEPSTASATPRARVLAIEDEHYNRLVLGHHLQRIGLPVDWAGSAEEAVSLIRLNTYDVILSDCSLPDAQGTEILTRLQAVVTPPPPVIVISAYATTAMRDSLLKAGAHSFVGKPIDAAKLQAALASVHLAARPLDDHAVTEPDHEQLNFERLIRLGQTATLLAEFAADVDALTHEIENGIAHQHAGTAAQVHKLRTTLLLCQATTATAQLETLETLLSHQPWPDEVGELWQRTRPEVAAVSAAARRVAAQHR